MLKNKFFKIFIYLFLFLGIAYFTLSFFYKDKKTNFEYEKYISEMKYFSSKDGKIAYSDNGDGKVFVLIHGVPTSSWMYKKLSDNLVLRGNRVIAVDLLGFGASDKPADYDVYAFDKQAKRVLALLENLNIESYNLVVHDMGGLVGWEILAENSTNIDQLYIFNTLVYGEDFHPPMNFSLENSLHRFSCIFTPTPYLESLL